MIALDMVEQLHAAALHPEHADAIADLRPFGIEVRCDELVGQGPDLEARGLGVAPVEPAAVSERDSTGQLHQLAGEKAQMLLGLIAAPWLVELPPAHAHHAVA